MKQKVRLFISYAQRASGAAESFCAAFEEYCACSRGYDYAFWRDVDLLPGEKWEAEIMDQLSRCDGGLLLISPSFLNSAFISRVELPALMRPDKVLIPVGLVKINLERHDLRGLKERQIYRLKPKGGGEARYWDQLGKRARADFIDGLFTALEKRLDKRRAMEPAKHDEA